MKTIFVVEDDSAINELIAYALRGEGFAVSGFGNGEAFLNALDGGLPDLVLLDIMLPGQDGLSILRRLRENTRTQSLPVILLTAKSTEYDKVVGLDSGADDYIAKPFGVLEMLSRVKAVLRRAGGAVQSDALVVGGVTLDAARHIVTAGGRELPLTLKEFELLRYLMEHRGQALTRDGILSTVWGYGFEGETRTVDVHVGTLRQKLGEYGSMIETVRGVGYRIGGGK
ncbi:winged helix-turn-helix domain-containing protein [Intestinibacillus massiliensis]|uniref:winged helix-turn-helix domain-containing protein n=1 Tax=Intestinibacillus massiliensis TaxID=1871029 RepID=UPI000B3587EC|nr:response regulator transcription factor [Intestinibacillus massiliensis]